MTLAAGTKLGPYEIVAPLGAGGMGEVYRARDARLGREVAIKVLPAAMADDAERMARFQREAHRNGDKMMAAAVETEPVFAAAKPKLLFEGHYETGLYPSLANYDVSPDGRRFLMIKSSEQETAATQINVVLNWLEDLKRRVPTAK